MSRSPIRAVVVGGGFAGISAAVEMARLGARVVLLEARGRAGGRASSHADPESGETLDNGQHVLLGSYTATLKLLRLLGTERLVSFQKRLTITSLEPGGRVVRLACPPLPAPAHLIAGLLTLKGLTLADKLALLRSAPSLMRLSGDGLTVEGWLDRLGQTENLRERFWRPIALAALNEDTRVAGASLLTAVLAEAFGGRASASAIGIPRAGLSDLYVAPAARYLSERGGELRTGAPATALHTEGGRVKAVELRTEERVPCDTLVLAAPHSATRKLLPPDLLNSDPRLSRLDELGSSPIVSVNIWFDRPVTTLGFFGLLGSPIQFVFNKCVLWDQEIARGGYLACVVSAASALASSTNEEITRVAPEEIVRYIPEARAARTTRTMVVREKQATFSGRPDVLSLRPPAQTAIPNLALAGDWTDTGLPGTIEGAVRSGLRAAQCLMPGDEEG